MPKFLIIVFSFCGILYASMLGFLFWNWDQTRRVFFSGEGGFFVLFVAILLPLIVGVMTFYVMKIRPQRMLKVWENAASDLGFEMIPGKFALTKQYEDYRIEIAADAERKLIAPIGHGAHRFSTLAAVKFEKPLPKEFKISKLRNKPPMHDAVFAKNEDLLDAIQHAMNQNFDVFSFTNEGVVVSNEGIVSNEEILKRMALSVKNICEVIYK